MTGCSAYQIVAGGTPVDVTSQKPPAPPASGDERWSQLPTFTAKGLSTVVKQPKNQLDWSRAVIESSHVRAARGARKRPKHVDAVITPATARSSHP
jgi:hypothetical protein